MISIMSPTSHRTQNVTIFIAYWMQHCLSQVIDLDTLFAKSDNLGGPMCVFVFYINKKFSSKSLLSRIYFCIIVSSKYKNIMKSIMWTGPELGQLIQSFSKSLKSRRFGFRSHCLKHNVWTNNKGARRWSTIR